MSEEKGFQKKPVQTKSIDLNKADEFINRASADNYSSEKIFKAPPKKRSEQKRMVVIFNDDLYNAWLQLQFLNKREGRNITFQKYAEKLFKTDLARFLK